MGNALIVFVFLVVLAVMVYLSVRSPRPTKRTLVTSNTRAIVKQPEAARDISRKIHDAYERAHRKNHEEKVLRAWELAKMLDSPINYSDPLPMLPDGETVDAVVEDVPLLPSGRTKSWTLREIREDWESNWRSDDLDT